jgi:hypothetical protein
MARLVDILVVDDRAVDAEKNGAEALSYRHLVIIATEGC